MTKIVMLYITLLNLSDRTLAIYRLPIVLERKCLVLSERMFIPTHICVLIFSKIQGMGIGKNVT